MFSVLISGAVTPTAVFSSMAHGELVRETEKAFLVEFDGKSVWLPKSGLEHNESRFKGDSGWYVMKEWLKNKMDDRNWNIIFNAAESGGVSAL